MDIPKDKETGMTVQDYHTEILEQQNKAIANLIAVCTNLGELAKVNLKEHDRLEKRIKSCESFIMGMFIGNVITAIILILLVVL